MMMVWTTRVRGGSHVTFENINHTTQSTQGTHLFKHQHHTGTMVFKDKNERIDSGSSDGYNTLVSHQYDTMVSNRNNDTIVATGHSSVPLYMEHAMMQDRVETSSDTKDDIEQKLKLLDAQYRADKLKLDMAYKRRREELLSILSKVKG